LVSPWAPWLSTAGLALSACGGHGEPSSDFIADNPGFSNDSGQGETGGASGGDDNGDGGREVSEADIVAIEDDRLYALSQYGGLTVIDASQPDRLPVLGRFRAHAMPFEMYVDQAQVFAMFSEFGHYGWEEDIGQWQWRTTSRLMALDASDPSSIAVRGEFDLPGTLSDSRRVGDVLYVVTYEDGWCWECQPTPNTTITSLDVADPARPRQVDQLVFEDEVDDTIWWWWGGSRPVYSTDERLYVAGVTAASDDSGHSTIDVVDISDPGGTLVAGAQVEVAGVIQSRWQMDEFEDVLRVVSQRGLWGGTLPPVIETFAVASAADVSPLGQADMTLPRPESLRTVRFDGPRAYAITFEQTDPLFTLDLTDPTMPRQVGALEIPGWVYHMEPRGDRVLGLGFDPQHADGSLNVSLFDVSDFEAPTMLSRAHFGGSWAGYGEDQDRIHKAFTVLDDLGLLLVPFSGWDYDDPQDCYGRYNSGIQLLDWADDAISLRGFAESHGQARRALLHRERLLGVSDKAVETFDISDRDAPQRTADVALAANVSAVEVRDGLVVRLANDWWTGDAALEVVSTSDPEAPEPLGRVSLGDLDAPPEGAECEGGPGFYGAELFALEGWAYLLYEVWDGTAERKESTRIAVFDVRDPLAPAFVQTVDLGYARGWGGWGGGVEVGAARTLQLGSALVLAREDGDTASLEIVDLSEPSSPVPGLSIPRPAAISHGNLLAVGDTVASWHMTAASEDATKVRFYLERLDVSDPTAPVAAAPVNVPGVVAVWDPASARAVTVDFQLETVALGENACWTHPRVYEFDQAKGLCTLARRQLHLVAVDDDHAAVLGTADVEGEDARLRTVTGNADHVFAHLVRQSDTGLAPDPVAILTGPSSGNLDEVDRVTLPTVGWAWVQQLLADGDRLLLSVDTGLVVVDARDPQAATVQTHDLYGWGCWDLTVASDIAYCAMGELGLQAIDLR
jgi:hypothetical protein